ncbi:MAG: hypothetical protein AB7E24_00425 [Novosphingobium sp.]
MMSPIKLRVLIDAKIFVETERARRSPDSLIIQELVVHFNAQRSASSRGLSLRCALVSAWCGHPKGERGLLDAWLKSAASQISKETGV